MCHSFRLRNMSVLSHRRRKIGVLADEKWKGEIPSFHSPEEKKELEEFVDEIEEECICPAVQFTRDGIKEHIKHYFYQKNRDLAKVLIFNADGKSGNGFENTVHCIFLPDF